ncbi:MAG: hypothetical protein IPK82_34515 [Polyangiaceae bacterium]|nr:hypothetical protein [Polyangiaceae bacterium]
MNVTVTFRATDDSALAVSADELATTLIDAGLNCTRMRRAPDPGEKGDIPLALMVTGLALQSIGVFIASLTFWRSTRPNYTLTVKQGDVTFTINNLDSAEALHQIESLKTAIASGDTSVEVSQVN